MAAAHVEALQACPPAKAVILQCCADPMCPSTPAVCAERALEAMLLVARACPAAASQEGFLKPVEAWLLKVGLGGAARELAARGANGWGLLPLPAAAWVHVSGNQSRDYAALLLV